MNERVPESGSTRFALRAFAWQAVLGGAYGAAAAYSGTVITGYGLDVLGMSKENVGLIGAFVWMAGFVQLCSFILSNRVSNKKAFVLGAGCVELLFVALVVTLPLLLPGGGRNWLGHTLFVALLCLAAMSSHLVQPLYSNWLAAIIPARVRGRYLGFRLVAAGVATLVFTWVAMWVVDNWKTHAGFSTVILGGVLFGALGLLLLLPVGMKGVTAEDRVAAVDLLDCFRRPSFRHLMLFTLMINAGFAFACPYYGAFFLKEVGLSYQECAVYTTAYSAVRLLLLYPIGKMVDRVGAKGPLYFAIVIYALFFFLFAFFTHERLWLIAAAWGMVAIGDAIYAVAWASVLYHDLPAGRQRTAALAIAQGLPLLIMAAGPFIVRAVFAWAGDASISVLGQHLEKFRIMFVICGFMVLASTPTLRRVRDTREAHFTQVLNYLADRFLVMRLFPRFFEWQRHDKNGPD